MARGPEIAFTSSKSAPAWAKPAFMRSNRPASSWTTRTFFATPLPPHPASAASRPGSSFAATLPLNEAAPCPCIDSAPTKMYPQAREVSCAAAAAARLSKAMGACVRVRIDSLAHGGAGVGRDADGRAVFVRGGCPGDLVEASVDADKGRYLLATVAEVLEPSPSRVTAPCPYFGTCGGCQWQHVDYAEQLRGKRGIVADAIERIARLDPDVVGDVVPSPEPYSYRNKVELAVRSTGGRLRLGFLAEHSHDLVEVDACLLLPESARRAPKALAGALRFLAGRLGTPVERVAYRVSARGDAEVALWSAPGPFGRSAVARVIRDAVSATGVTRVLFKGDAKERRASKVEVLSGRGWWQECLGRYDYAVSSPSFFQVNTAAAELLVDEVILAAAPDGSDRVLDVFSGVGTFTLPLAEHAGATVAVESSAFALRDLRRNLESARLEADIAPGDAERVLEGVGPVDVAVVDPPRSGMERPALARVLACGPERLVYVSCDPATLARDAAMVTASGLTLVSVTPVDLFPQTSHVESVALFERLRD
ncbi:MAG: 23S rRNA (uracil(1939)-C(5))-methyltransferase RlmD [Coriobacteriaceae bacterium]|nr:23S rRNA (uracil(1939)-C(5))-methyltransferase RlmD [Coriobacteriaceae bacterium]